MFLKTISYFGILKIVRLTGFILKITRRLDSLFFGSGMERGIWLKALKAWKAETSLKTGKDIEA